ncbi:MAG: FxsA family protein [Spirochaetales bacterium]|nr:FxsA family protein [Spirochaetales bacterium]
MLETNIILKLFNKNFIFKVVILTLLYTLIPLMEIFLLIFIGEKYGNYLMLALAASTGFLGVIIALAEINNALSNLKIKIREAHYPQKEFTILAGVFTGCVLLITPGFITDFLGFLMFVPIVRNKIGGAITKALDKTLKEIYEYLKVYEL